ncbi:tachylectin-related carbohydrate-binding protein [Amycolatopsis sp. NPDC004079]|uniref:tachylectin-related carbohydrate-binding protein n=1 Tax=Amycolatopsis sp. NPDC004079 TaxID=3154549 RepID=UPI0033B241FC
MRRTRSSRLAALSAAAAVAVTGLAAPAAHAVTGGTTAGGWDEPLQIVARITVGDLGRGCSGIAIARRWVITAASCFATDPAKGFQIPPGPPPMPTVVKLGTYAIPATMKPNGGSIDGATANAVELIPRTDRDVVLVRVDADLPQSGARIAPKPPVPGEQLSIAGFGRTENEWVPTKLHVAKTAVTSVSTNSIEVAGTSSTCKGDAGGPTMRGDYPELVATHGPSSQHGCLAETGTSNGSTEIRLDDIYTWILDKVPDMRAFCGYPTSVLAMRGGKAWESKHENDTPDLEPLASLTGTGHWTDLAPSNAALTPNGTVRQGWALWEVHRKTGPQDPLADGDLRRWIYNTTPSIAAKGWQRFLDPAHENQITATSSYYEDRIYTIGANGELRVFRWNNYNNTWDNPDGEVIDTGWDKYDSITASDSGVLYARTTDGRLIRFRYDFGSHRWTQRDKQIGTGWNVMRQIFSPGGDIIYASGASKNGTPTLRWYQYYSELDSWAPGDADGMGKVVGQGSRWDSSYRFTTDSNNCGAKHTT